MANEFVQLSDLYSPLPFDNGVSEKAIELNRFLQSGIMVMDDQVSNMATVGGLTGEMPFFKPLSTTEEPDYTSDDPSSLAESNKIGTSKEIYRLAKMHRSYSTMDFARELGLVGMDPLSEIVNKVGAWWATQIEKRVISTVTGIIADNVANDSSDMVVDIYSDVASPAATNIISAEAVLDAKQTMGDHAEQLSAIAMHSVTYTNLQKANLIDFIPNSQGVVNIPTYLGYIVVVDDSLVVAAGTNSPSYTTLLFATGALRNGTGRMLVPSEIDRVPNAGDGGGQDILHTRRNEIIHPNGFQCTGTPAGTSLTLAELEAATTWDRVVDRKNVGIAALIHNN